MLSMKVWEEDCLGVSRIAGVAPAMSVKRENGSEVSIKTPNLRSVARTPGIPQTPSNDPGAPL